MIVNGDLKHLKKIELQINKHLYLICGGVTLVTMAMIAIEFFTRGIFPPTNIHLFYLGILIIYSLHKELVRWLGERKVERQGEYFVYGWIVFTTLLYIINFSTKHFFSYSCEGEPLNNLRELCILTLEVLVIFLVTRGSKLIRLSLTKKETL
jgi:hypothetical protein